MSKNKLPSGSSGGPSGFLLVNKSPGQTSFRSLDLIKRSFGTKRVGHTGTLDSFADGLMLVLVGSYTRFSHFCQGWDKSYRATIRFGEETDTLDPEGDIIGTGAIPEFSEIESKVASFVGRQDQTPPVFSAIHVGKGKRAHQIVRDGGTVELASRSIEIYSISIVSLNSSDLIVDVSCSKGTYIRSLARDLGRSLGTHARLQNLTRTRVGDFSLDESIRMEDFQDGAGSALDEDSKSRILHTRPEDLKRFPGLGVINLIQDFVPDFYFGKPIRDEWFDPPVVMPGVSAVFMSNGQLAGAVNKDSHYRYLFVCGAEP